VQADGRTTPFDRAKALKRSGLAASRQTLPLSESPPTQARRCSRSTRNFGLCAARSQLDAEPAGAVSDNPPVIVEGPGKPRLPERRVLRIALALNAAMFIVGLVAGIRNKRRDRRNVHGGEADKRISAVKPGTNPAPLHNDARPDEFIRRFLLHVLPKGFHRIRHYALLPAPAARPTSRAPKS